MTEKRDTPGATVEASAMTGAGARTTGVAKHDRSDAQEAGSEKTGIEKTGIEKTGAAEQIGRRKLLYAAPVIMSQSMFYALAGCGKAQPQQINCFRVPRSGS